MTEIAIRLLLKRGNQITDDLYDVEPSDFGGTIPAIGDRVVQMLKEGQDGYRVTDRIFETGGRINYVTLVVEEDDLADLIDVSRFTSQR